MSSSLATATTIKAPVRETLAFVGYHLRQGVDHMFMYFDDPKDASIPYLRETDAVTCVKCDEAHWRRHGIDPEATVQVKQHANATEGFRRAREGGYDWLAHIDGDELLHAKKSLTDLLARSPAWADVLIFPSKEALPQAFSYEHPFQQISLFKYNPAAHLRRGTFPEGRFQKVKRRVTARIWRDKRRFLRWTGFDHPDFLESFLLGHTNGKAATRTAAPVAKIGNHLPRAEGGSSLQRYALLGGSVLHFDCMGYQRWRDKWTRRLDGSARFDTSRFRPDRQRILQAFDAALQTGQENRLRSLYRRMYMLSASERIVLRGLGFLEHISLRESSFSPAGGWSFDTQQVGAPSGGELETDIDRDRLKEK